MTKQQEASGTKRDTIPRDDYSLLFANYVARGISAALAIVDHDSNILSDEQQNRVLHTLSIALQREEIWPQARTLLLRSSSHMEKAGLRDDWILLLQRGVQLGDKLEDQETLAELYLQLSFLYQLRNQFPQAEYYCQASVKTFSFVGDIFGQARGLNQWAYLAQLQRSFRRASNYATTALRLLPEGDVRQASSHVVLGWIAAENFELDAAQVHFSHALTLWEMNGDKRQIARRLRELGDIFQRQKRYQLSLSYYVQANDLFKSIHDRFENAVTCMNLAMVYWALGMCEEAVEQLQTSIPVFREVKDNRHLAMAYNNQGIVYRHLKMWDEAKLAFGNSITLWTKLGNIDSLINVLDEFALTLGEIGEYDDATKLFQRAIDYLSRMKSDPAYLYRQKKISKHLYDVLSHVYSNQDEKASYSGAFNQQHDTG